MSLSRNLPFFYKGLSENTLQLITQSYQRKHIKKNTYIHLSGNVSDNITFVLSGRIVLELTTDQGDTHLFLPITARQFFGESCCLLESPSILSARTAVDSVIIQIPWAELREYLLDNPALMLEMYQSTTSKMKSAIQQIEMLSFTGPVRRVMGALHWFFTNEGEPFGDGWRVRTNLATHQTIAELTGFSRVAVSNAFKQLYKSNTIRKEDGYYYVDSLSQLLP